jgi:endonuclease/exonuclease/phosphatase family metal-dependent hydrolase
MTWNLMKIFEKDKKGVEHRKIDPEKRSMSIIKEIKRYKPDILCLQEASDIFYELKSRLC